MFLVQQHVHAHHTHTHTSPACNGAAAFCSFHSKGTVESKNDRRDTPSIAHAKTVPAAMADEIEDRLGKTHRDALLNTFCRVFFQAFLVGFKRKPRRTPHHFGGPLLEKTTCPFRCGANVTKRRSRPVSSARRRRLPRHHHLRRLCRAWTRTFDACLPFLFVCFFVCWLACLFRLLACPRRGCDLGDARRHATASGLAVHAICASSS